jgi:hypothetical protein
MKTLKHIQKDQGWAEWTDLTPSRILGSLWGVPFYTLTDNPLEPDHDDITQDEPEVLEAIRIIDKADAWNQWYAQAKRLCEQAEA